MAHICKCCGGEGKIEKDTCYYCQGERQVTCRACEGTGIVED